MVDGNLGIVGGIKQFGFGQARQAGLQAQQSELQNDLTLADNIRKLSGTDAALEFWKTTASSQRISFDKIKPLPGDTETIQVKDNGVLVGFQRFDAQGKGTFTSREEAGIPAAAPKERKGVTRGPGQAVTDPVTGEEIAPQLPLKPGKTLGEIEAEAKAKALGTAAGKPLKPTKEPRPDIITFTKGNRTVTARRGSAEAKGFRAQGFTEGKVGKLPAGQTFLLPDSETFVTSFDGGRTYTTDAGENIKLPSGSVPVDVELRAEDLRIIKAQKEAVAEVSKAKTQQEITIPSAREAALGGTGPFAKVAATIDAIAGGLGIDLIFGKEGLFPKTQENRQLLRTIKQLGKAALIISSRGAIWEQERIDRLFPDPDKTWRNPRTEAAKFKVLRETLEQERIFNLEAIASAVSPKEIDNLRKSTLGIERLLALITSPEETATGPQEVEVGRRATNPQTGETLRWDGNKWQPTQ